MFWNFVCVLSFRPGTEHLWCLDDWEFDTDFHLHDIFMLSVDFEVRDYVLRFFQYFNNVVPI